MPTSTTVPALTVYKESEEPSPNAVPTVTGATETSTAVCKIINKATQSLQVWLADRELGATEDLEPQAPPATQGSTSAKSPGSE